MCERLDMSEEKPKRPPTTWDAPRDPGLMDEIRKGKQEPQEIVKNNIICRRLCNEQ